MKSNVIKFLSTLFLVCILSLLSLHFYLLDGLQGWFFSGGVFTEDTVYAEGYSDKGFRSVRTGMSQQDVLDILGIPIEEIWVYENFNTREITIWFDEKGIVVEIFPDAGMIANIPQIREGMKKKAGIECAKQSNKATLEL